MGEKRRCARGDSLLHIILAAYSTSMHSESISLVDQPSAKKRIVETILFVVDKYESVGDKALKRLCSRARRRHLRSRHELRRVHVASAEFRQGDEHFKLVPREARCLQLEGPALLLEDLIPAIRNSTI